MANNNKTILIWTASGTTMVLATTGNYDLRVSPYSSTGIAGVHQGGGAWNFSGLDDTAEYKLYNTDTATVIDSLNAGGTTVFFDGDLQLYLKKAGGTMSGTIAMGTNKITGLGAGTANGDAVRWEQTGVITEARTITGVWTFDNAIPRVNAPTTTGYPTSNVHLTNKYYVDTLFSSAVGVIQSTYLSKLIPLRAVEDNYSRTTPELCYSYLSALTDIATRSGTVLVEPSGVAGNSIDVDNHATNQWIGDGIFYQGVGKKPIINRKGYNTALTTTGGFVNCRIKDGAAGTPVVSARSYTNFTFQDCEFDVPDATDITFITCKFLGINKLKSASGNTITLTNCTGDAFWHNDDITPAISGTQPIDVRAVTAANLNW